MNLTTKVVMLFAAYIMSNSPIHGQTAYGKGVDNPSSNLSIPKTTEEMIKSMKKDGILKNLDKVYNAKEDAYLNQYYNIIARLWEKMPIAGGDINLYLNGSLDSLVVHTNFYFSGQKNFKFEMVNEDSCYSEQSWERFEYGRNKEVFDGAWVLKDYYSVDKDKKLNKEKLSRIGKPFSPDAMVVTEVIRKLTNGDIGGKIKLIYAGKEYEVDVKREYLKSNPELEILSVDMSNFDKKDMWVDYVKVTTLKSNGKNVPISSEAVVYLFNMKFLKVYVFVQLTSVQETEYIKPEKQSIFSDVLTTK